MVYRSNFGKWLTLVTLLVLVWAVILTAVESPLAAIGSLPAALLIQYLVYLLFWIPRVEVIDTGVFIHNVLMSHFLPWSAIQRIDTKWSLTIFTESGKISAFGAPAPGRHASLTATKQDGSFLPETSYVSGTLRPGDLVTSDSGAAAAAIRRAWERNRDSTGGQTSKTFHTKRLVFLLLITGAVFIALL